MTLRPAARMLCGVLALTVGLAALTSPAAAADRDTTLDRVAEAHDISRAEALELLADPATEVGAGGRVYYIDPAPTSPGPQVDPAPAEAPLGDTFRLHSLPGAKRTIFLDFDGATVSGTAWNATTATKPLPSRFYPGWDSAGNGAGFNDIELQRIQSIWARVAEDFAPFDVDVTTEDPGDDGIVRSASTDDAFGTRVLFTDDPEPVNVLCGGGCGGVAFVGSYDLVNNGTYQPAWVFPPKPGSTDGHGGERWTWLAEG